MIDICTFKWSTPGYRSQYTGEHVNIMRSMIERQYGGAYRFTCITDDARGIDPRVRVLPLWDDFKDELSPHGGNNPSCFRRLKLYSAEALEWFSPRILQIDLDMVLVGDMRPLWNRPEPEGVLWADNLNPTSPYNGAMQLITPGLHSIWEDFQRDPGAAIERARMARFFGSDQAQLALWLGPNMPRWRAADGALSWRVHLRQTPMGQAHIPYRPGVDCASDLPPGARCVNFHGIDDPATVAPFVPWVAENYQ